MSNRPHCSQCLRPLRACWCASIQKVDSQVQLLVLQHPLEAGHAKNTARLLHLCVPGSRLEVGEVFTAADLQQLLHAPWPGQAMDAEVRPVLLYPATLPDPQLPIVQPPALPSHWLKQVTKLRLVVIDGTWRKSRKMLYLNPGLQHLPRLALHEAPSCRYAIRKAQAPGQLSSFEAAAHAMAQLQEWGEQHPAWQRLMRSFDDVMAQHQHLKALGNAP